jgi:uncharacterized membrane protein YeaQ/YmgE (transglycosylase-associated protein family)
MSKIITAIVLAVICGALASFVLSNNPALMFTEVHAVLVGAIAGLILG